MNNSSDHDHDVSVLLSMGFDRHQAIQALDVCGSLAGAIKLLTSGQGIGHVEQSIDTDCHPCNVLARREVEVDHPPLKLIDDDCEEFPLLSSDVDEKMSDTAESPNYLQRLGGAAPPAPSSPDHVELIEDADGPEPPFAMTQEFHSYSKKSAALTARLELVEDYDGPEPPTAIMRRFHDNTAKSTASTARMENVNDSSAPKPPDDAIMVGSPGNLEKTAALVSRGLGALVGSNIETMDSLASFDSFEGRNYFRSNDGAGRNEMPQRSGDFSYRNDISLGGVGAISRSCPVDVIENVDDEEKNGSISSKSASNEEILTDSEQEEFVAIIPEAFLVEETEGEIILATLIAPTPPWWKVRRTQQIFSIVFLLVAALSTALGVLLWIIHKNKILDVAGNTAAASFSMAPSASVEEIGKTATPELSMSPSASLANILATQSPSSAPACSLDSNCGATLEIWTGIEGYDTYDLRFATNGLTTTPDKRDRLSTLLEAPNNTDDKYGIRMKGWLNPPVTGNYTFWIAADDWAELLLSTNHDPSKKELICYDHDLDYVNGSGNSRNWTNSLEQESSPRWLFGGQLYYFEVRVQIVISWQTLNNLVSTHLPSNFHACRLS